MVTIASIVPNSGVCLFSSERPITLNAVASPGWAALATPAPALTICHLCALCPHILQELDQSLQPLGECHLRQLRRSLCRLVLYL
jgi:hypothetical protein